MALLSLFRFDFTTTDGKKREEGKLMNSIFTTFNGGKKDLKSEERKRREKQRERRSSIKLFGLAISIPSSSSSVE